MEIEAALQRIKSVVGPRGWIAILTISAPVDLIALARSSRSDGGSPNA